MTFLAPWFLLGLLAAMIPLLLHLRRSRQTRSITFSTTQFFDERFVRAARRAQLQDRLLMLLRMAMFALLALALSQPLLRTVGLPMLGDGPRHVAIVIDDSLTMGVSDGDGTLLDRAKVAAGVLVDDLSPARGDRATVVLAGAREAGPRALFDAPSDDFTEVRRAIEAIEPTDLGGDLDAAVQRAARAIDASADAPPATAGQREIYVYSDVTEAALRATDALPAAETASLVVVPVRPASPSVHRRVAVDVVQYGAARPMAGVPFHFRARLTNHASEPTSVTAQLVIDDAVVAEREADVPAQRSQIVRFTHRFTGAGWHAGRVTLPDTDANEPAGAQQRHFALHVQDQVRVLAVNGAPSSVRQRDELFYFTLALTARPREAVGVAGPVELDTIEPAALDEADLGGYPLVVLANVRRLSDAQAERLERYVDRGGSVFIALGDRVEPAAYNRLIGTHRLHDGLLPARLGPVIDSAGSATRASDAHDDHDELDVLRDVIATADTDHPMLAGFEAGGLGRLSGVRFDRRFALEPVEGEAAHVLMRDAAGQPLLIERTFGRGRVMLFASGLNRAWTNFPLQPTYVPWLYRMVSYLSQQTTPEANFVRTGAIVSLPGGATGAAAYRIHGPQGATFYPERDPRRPEAAGALALTETDRAGVYAVREARDPDDAPPITMFAANVPPEATRRVYLDETDVRASVGAHRPLAVLDASEDVAAAAAGARHGQGLWNALLWLALAVALFEPWLANRLAQRRASRAPDPAQWRNLGPGERVPRPLADGSREMEAVR